MNHNSGEKEFLGIINDMLGDFGKNPEFPERKLRNMASAYHKLSDEQQERCLSILYNLLSDIYAVEINIMAVLFTELKDKKIIPYIEKTLMSKKYPLWGKLNDFVQFRTFLFTHCILKENERYHNINGLYESHLCELMEEAKISFPYIPYKSRGKKIIIVASQLVNIFHAPTKRMLAISHYYRNIGYDVECFVCHLRGIEGGWDLAGGVYKCNFMEKSSDFDICLNGRNIKGYNFSLNASHYKEELKRAVRMIWEEKPEYVFEIGTETILAGLCCPFTTVVTMGCTKNIPVSNAPIFATPMERSQEEQESWKQILGKDRISVEIRHVVNGLEKKESEICYSKKDFGIPSESFVIILAGSRLDKEVEESFLEIIDRILALEEHFMIAVIGKCPKLKERISKGKWPYRFFFLGTQKKFREAIAIGDVFLNPPRQGGGTGSLYAIMEGVPVITLDHCDVKANVGDKFVCGCVEEMPSLVLKYFTDEEFRKEQKENCRKRAMEQTNIDSIQSFQKLSDIVKEYAVSQEKEKSDTI